MIDADPRYQPLVELDHRQLRELIAPIAGGAAVREAVLLDGGLINTVYGLTLAPGGAALTVRIYPEGDADAIEAEIALLATLRPALPVPEVLWADPRGERSGHAYLVYRWIQGITLNEYRRGATTAELARLAAPLGELLARIAGHPAPVRPAAIDVGEEIEQARHRVRYGLARERLGDDLADRLDQLLEESGPALAAAGEERCLVHGDLGGRNILVAAESEGPWRVTGIVDWDCTRIGSRLWDVGSFFRYANRFDRRFVERFAAGYAEGGGRLPDDWWRAARLLDATRVITILDDDRPLARLYAECRFALTGVLQDHGALG